MTDRNLSEDPAVSGQEAPRRAIGPDEIRAAYATLLKYRAGKANLEKRIVDDQQWYKLRQWECLRKTKKEQIEPASARRKRRCRHDKGGADTARYKAAA